MQFLYPLITGIHHAFRLLFQINPAVFERFEIMPAPPVKDCAKYFPAGFVCDSLGLLPVALFPAPII
jgi:hypothetical protein